MATGQEEDVISTTPAITLTGTWFSRVGTAPYELLGLIERTSVPTTGMTVLPRMDLAA